MKEQQEQVRVKAYEKYFSNGTIIKKESIEQLLQSLERDHESQQMFRQQLPFLLSSRKRNLSTILHYCVFSNPKQYHQSILTFFASYFHIPNKNQKENNVILDRQLELYIIQEVWKPHMVRYLQLIGLRHKRIVIYLSLKMRSLQPDIRKEALESLYELVKETVGGQAQEWAQNMGEMLPKMIEKETLAKKVSYYRGVLLQMLEDEYHDIKKKCVELLGMGRKFLEPKTLQPIILYMLNDQHEIVRSTALTTLLQLAPLELDTQDLNALLMCLREKNIQLRSNVYDNIPNINITQYDELELIMQKLCESLIRNKGDKKKIYTVCRRLGQKCPDLISRNIDRILNYKQEEPNWKSLVYKAKIILIGNIGEDKWDVPAYFTKHYLYIRDIEYYAFQRRKDDVCVFPVVKVETKQQLKLFVKAQIRVRVGFAKEIYRIVETVFKKEGRWEDRGLQELSKLRYKYNIEKQTQEYSIMRQMEEILKQVDETLVRDLVIRLQDPKYSQVELSTFKPSSHEPNCIIISNNTELIDKGYLSHHGKYIAMRQLEPSQTDEHYRYYYYPLQPSIKFIAVYWPNPLLSYTFHPK